MTARRRALLAALSGLLLGLTFPNLSLVFLLPLALVPLLFALDGVGARAGGALGLLFGMAFWAATIPWIAYTVHRYGEMPWPVALLALLVTTFLVGLYFVVPGLLVGAVAPRTPRAVLFTWPAAWVVGEWARIHVASGFPWALLANPLADHPAFLQTAALGGVLLTSGLVVLVNALVFEALRASGRAARLRYLASACAIVAGAGLFGRFRMSALDAASSARTWIRVGVVQPNVHQEVRWAGGSRDAMLADLLDETRDLARRERPDLVVWPESASPYSFSFAPSYQTALRSLAEETGAALLFNTVWSDAPDDEDAPYFNSALLVTAQGPVLPPYHKLRLVPFGEYVPFAKALRILSPISRAVPGQFTPGGSAHAIPFRASRLGGMVCYEVVYPWIARAHARAGAGLLFTLTNDDWYGRSGARRQHWQAAVVRAVETGRPLVRAAVTGISGFVSPSGRVLATIGPDRKGSFALDVPGPPATQTLATLVGELPAAVCALGLGVAILRRRRARR